MRAADGQQSQTNHHRDSGGVLYYRADLEDSEGAASDESSVLYWQLTATHACSSRNTLQLQLPSYDRPSTPDTKLPSYSREVGTGVCVSRRYSSWRSMFEEVQRRWPAVVRGVIFPPKGPPTVLGIQPPSTFLDHRAKELGTFVRTLAAATALEHPGLIDWLALELQLPTENTPFVRVSVNKPSPSTRLGISLATRFRGCTTISDLDSEGLLGASSLVQGDQLISINGIAIESSVHAATILKGLEGEVLLNVLPESSPEAANT